MSKGDELFLHPLTHRCLLLGQEMYFKSRGVFDITLGVKIEQLKNGSKDQGDQEGGWEIDPERPKILCGQAGRQLDLGGIGKGFALDVMAEYLRDWQPCDMVISAGASTQLVLGSREKRFELLGDSKRMIIGLEGLCLSASGIGIQGVHIVSPQGLEGQPTFRRAWCIAKGAAFADAWSTAAMLMELGELEDILAENDEVIKFICEGHDGVWVEVGSWGGGVRWIDGD
jgi:thiamine biosynthesis lipoprotein